MSSDPNTTSSGTSQNDQVNTQGVVPTVLSYVGLGGSSSNNPSEGQQTDDKGAVAGMGAGAAAATGAAGMAAQQGHGPLGAAAGATAAAGAAGAAVYGGSRAGANDAAAEPAFGAAVRPSNSAIGSDHEEHARDVAARAVGGTTSGSGSGFGSGVGSGAEAAGSDSLNSRGGSLAGSGVGGRDGTTTGSSIAGAGATEAGLEGTSGGIGERKESRAAFGASEGANADESKTSAEPRHTEGQGSSQNQSGGNTGGPTGKLENKDAIPVAGGVKLGEKHWGESGIVPDNPKPAEEKNISSSEGQPDQSTRDNTSANTGGASGPAGSGSGSGSNEGEHKEGLMDKVKGKLHGSH